MQTKLIPYIIIGVLLVAGVAGASWYFATKQPAPSAEEAPVVEDETADWKSYESAKMGFSMKYPPDWEVYEETISSKTTIYFNIGEPGSIPQFEVTRKRDYDLSLKKYLTLEEVINQRKDELKGYAELKEENIIVDNHPAIRLSREFPTGEDISTIYTAIYIEKEESMIYRMYTYTASSQKEIYMPVFNQMLSTFRFSQ